MAAPSKSWVVLSDAMTDADSPLDTTLMTGIRDDLVHLEEWLGMSYTAAQDHDHDGVNSKLIVSVADGAITPPKLAPSSGAYTSAVFALDTERTFTAGTRGSYILLKSRRLYTGGLYRVSFDAYKNSDDPCNAKLFIDDVTAGTEQTLTGTYQTFTEDIIIAPNNKVLQLKVQVQSGTASDIIYVRNFRAYLKFMESVTVTDASV